MKIKLLNNISLWHFWINLDLNFFNYHETYLECLTLIENYIPKLLESIISSNKLLLQLKEFEILCKRKSSISEVHNKQHIKIARKKNKFNLWFLKLLNRKSKVYTQYFNIHTCNKKSSHIYKKSRSKTINIILFGVGLD